MSGQYGGDEVNALVIDPGSHTTRAGFAGEDTPKCLISSNYGVAANGVDKFYGESRIHVPRQGMEIKSYVSGGVITDFDAAGDFWQHTFERHLRAPTAEHPLMITEPSWNSGPARGRTLEIAFEKLDSPAAYLLKNGVASAFAAGKSTALIIDIGHHVTSVTPVFDGVVLKRGLHKHEHAGAALNAEVEQMFAARNIRVVPHYSVKRKGRAETGEGATIDEGEGMTPSYLAAQRTRIVEEFKENILQVHEGRFDDGAASDQRTARSFEFPHGASETFRAERFRIPEALFTDSDDGKRQSIQHLVQQALQDSEPDTRPQLMQNIIVTGGSTLIPGAEARIQMELSNLYSGQKVRIFAAGNTIERKCSSWLGGSILSSLGTFHQLWFSRQEYDEAGADRLAVIEKRCR